MLKNFTPRSVEVPYSIATANVPWFDPRVVPPVITSDLNVNIASGYVSCSYQIEATQSQPFPATDPITYLPNTFNATNLPVGFTVNFTTGVITGTLTPGMTTKPTHIQIYAQNSGGEDIQTLTLNLSYLPYSRGLGFAMDDFEEYPASSSVLSLAKRSFLQGDFYGKTAIYQMFAYAFQDFERLTTGSVTYMPIVSGVNGNTIGPGAVFSFLNFGYEDFEATPLGTFTRSYGFGFGSSSIIYESTGQGITGVALLISLQLDYILDIVISGSDISFTGTPDPWYPGSPDPTFTNVFYQFGAQPGHQTTATITDEGSNNPSNVSITHQPTAINGYATTIRCDDSSPGGGHLYQFLVTWS